MIVQFPILIFISGIKGLYVRVKFLLCDKSDIEETWNNDGDTAYLYDNDGKLVSTLEK
jgi:hypothetical protein